MNPVLDVKIRMTTRRQSDNHNQSRPAPALLFSILRNAEENRDKNPSQINQVMQRHSRIKFQQLGYAEANIFPTMPTESRVAPLKGTVTDKVH
jgi:hypothetical protein